MKILVVRLSSLGDVVLTLPALAFIRQQRPEAHVTFLTKSIYAPVLEGQTGVNEVWAMDTRGKDAGVSGGLKVLRRIRAAHFDFVLDLHANARANFLSRLSGAKVVRVKNYGFNRRLRAWFPGLALPVPPDVTRRGVEAAARLLRVAAPAGAAAGQLLPETGALEWAKRFLNESGIKPGQKLLGIAPGAAWATKRWSAGYFAQAMGLLADEDKIRFLFVGDQRDAELSREILGYARKGAEQAVVAAGLTDLAQLTALISRCDAFLSNDSGPMHVASALGVPVLALFGPTIEAFGFFPRGEKDKVLQQDLDCRPCSVHGSKRCPLDTHACMEGIAPFDVARALREVLCV